MNQIREYLFKICFAIHTAIVYILFLPLIFINKNFAFLSTKIWSKGLIFGLKYICNVKVIVEGKENIPKDKGYLIISKHQSSWETVAFLLFFNKTTYVIKKELMKSIYIATYAKVLNFISLDRSNKVSSSKKIIEQSINLIKNNRTLVIFPEGKRSIPDKKTIYRSGCFSIYEQHSEKNFKCIPIALNSGLFVSNKNKITAGTITVRILPPMPDGLNKKQFIEYLENHIEKNSQELVDKELKKRNSNT